MKLPQINPAPKPELESVSFRVNAELLAMWRASVKSYRGKITQREAIEYGMKAFIHETEERKRKAAK